MSLRTGAEASLVLYAAVRYSLLQCEPHTIVRPLSRYSTLHLTEEHDLCLEHMKFP